MSRVVVLGAGISGHTSAAFLRKWLAKKDEVVVISPQPTYNWIPSNIWVGVGLMRTEPDPGVNKMNAANPPSVWFYATKPTRMAVFLRTFVPYQLWRFLWLNLKMLAIIRRSHKGHA